MAKMLSIDVFKYHNFVLSKILRIYSETSEYYEAFSTYYVLIVLLTFVTSGIAFCFAHLADLALAIRALTFITGSFQAMCMYFFYVKNVSKTRIVHIKLQAIVDGIVESK